MLAQYRHETEAGWIPESRVELQKTTFFDCKKLIEADDLRTARLTVPKWIEDLVVSDPGKWWYACREHRKRIAASAPDRHVFFPVNIVANCCRLHQLIGEGDAAEPVQTTTVNVENDHFTLHSRHEVFDIKKLPEQDGVSTSI